MLAGKAVVALTVASGSTGAARRCLLNPIILGLAAFAKHLRYEGRFRFGGKFAYGLISNCRWDFCSKYYSTGRPKRQTMVAKWSGSRTNGPELSCRWVYRLTPQANTRHTTRIGSKKTPNQRVTSSNPARLT
jgi:hypothetical protein